MFPKACNFIQLPIQNLHKLGAGDRLLFKEEPGQLIQLVFIGLEQVIGLLMLGTHQFNDFFV